MNGDFKCGWFDRGGVEERKRTTYFTVESNGVSSTLNVGMEMLRGTHLSFINYIFCYYLFLFLISLFRLFDINNYYNAQNSYNTTKHNYKVYDVMKITKHQKSLLC